MYYNFGNIPFYTESNYRAITTTSEKYNIGYYSGIEKNGTEITSNTDGSDLFLTSNDYSVRMLTLSEINNDRRDVEDMSITSTTAISSTHEPAAGLYVLQNIKNISELSSNTYAKGSYWLTAPVWITSAYVHYVDCDGYVGGYASTNGVRPVISLSTGVNYSVRTGSDSSSQLSYLILTPTT